MPMVRINPRASDRPYLRHAGTYGQGQENSCEVELADFDFQVDSGDGPGWDRECKKDNYSKFSFKVKHPEFGLCRLDHFEPHSEGSGSRALKFLANLGVAVDSATGEFDDQSVAPRACSITVGDPYIPGDGRANRSGRILNVIGS